MVRGIGVDTVDIRRIEKMLTERPDSAFFRHAYTEAELAAVPDTTSVHRRAEYLAARFAVKEAVFKAVAHLTPKRAFDFRFVETLNREDGSPFISLTEELKPVLEAAGVDTLHLSITTETDYATAFVVACQGNH